MSRTCVGRGEGCVCMFSNRERAPAPTGELPTGRPGYRSGSWVNRGYMWVVVMSQASTGYMQLSWIYKHDQ